MTRKRFVKLLMADGYSRNASNTIAADARNCGMKYSNAYKAESAMRAAKLKFQDVDFTAVCDAIRNVAEMAIKVASAMAKAVGAFAETYTKEMEVNHE